MEQGYLTLLLHAHLPFVRHPEYEQFLEEDWLYEAITETYIPLIRIFERMEREGLDYRITMSLTPPLISMLTDPLLQSRYLRHIKKLIELAEKEVTRTRFLPKFHDTAKMYLSLFEDTRRIFEDVYRRNIVLAFRKFAEQGKLEIITCGATHGFLPFMEVNQEAVNAQIEVAVSTHEKHLGSKPKAIWLPECGFLPGHDRVLKKHGIRAFFTDSHGILLSNPRPKYGVFAPVFLPSGVAAFGRDVESSRSVWSAEVGYPGDYDYREFYRDIGFDLDLDYIKDYIHPAGFRINTGIKYFRITDKGGGEKKPYDFEMARKKAAIHAEDFYEKRLAQIGHLQNLMDRAPLVVSPYDAELFGHWWFEGPHFLEALLRVIGRRKAETGVSMITPSEYLERYKSNQVVELDMSTWGAAGYGSVWLNDKNHWIYRHLHKCADHMVTSASRFKNRASRLEERALNQMARELLLAQSSDWAFIINSGTMVEYAERRTKDHINRFLKLYEDLMSGTVEESFLNTIEYRDNIFPDLDFRVYASPSGMPSRPFKELPPEIPGSGDS